MYTILWKEDDADRWDRFQTIEEVYELLNQLEANENVCENDIWIFSPNADMYATDYNGFC